MLQMIRQCSKKFGLTLRKGTFEIIVYSSEFQGKIMLQWSINNTKQHSCGNSLNVETPDRASYFCKQQQCRRVCIDGFYDGSMFRLSKMLVIISGVADGISVHLFRYRLGTWWDFGFLMLCHCAHWTRRYKPTQKKTWMMIYPTGLVVLMTTGKVFGNNIEW